MTLAAHEVPTIESNFRAWMLHHLPKVSVESIERFETHSQKAVLESFIQEDVDLIIIETFPSHLQLIDAKGILLDYAMGRDWAIGPADNHGPQYIFSLREPKGPGMQISVGRISQENRDTPRDTYLNSDFDIHPFAGSLRNKILRTGEVLVNWIRKGTTNQQIVAEGLRKRGIDVNV